MGRGRTQKLYYENGNLKSVCNFVDGKENGAYKDYFEDGTPSTECNYVNGKISGICNLYWENGGIAYIDKYQNGKMTQRKAFNRYGKQLWSQNY